MFFPRFKTTTSISSMIFENFPIKSLRDGNLIFLLDKNNNKRHYGFVGMNNLNRLFILFLFFHCRIVKTLCTNLNINFIDLFENICYERVSKNKQKCMVWSMVFCHTFPSESKKCSVGRQCVCSAQSNKPFT